MTTEQKTELVMDINQQGATSPEEYEAARMAAKFAMTNAELAEAISTTFTLCQVRHIGGQNARDTDPGKAAIDHLKELLKIQQARAGFVNIATCAPTHNAKLTGSGTESG